MQISPITRRHALALLSAAMAGLVAAQGAAPAAAKAAAPAWQPTKPVTLVVSVAPGSSVDMVARLLAEKLPPVLGQPVIVVNRPGAGGLIAAQFVARAEPDGHTLLVGSNTMLGAPHTMPKGSSSSVDVIRDLAPIIIPATSPMVVMANPALGVKNAKELVAYLKKKPGLPYATAGQGSPFHFAGEMFKSASGSDMTHAPYKGVMPAVVDTVAGQVMLTFGALGGVGQFIDSGKLVAVAVGEKQRTRLLPDVPTLRESGVPIDFTLFFPVFAPARTPAVIVDRLNREMATIMQLPEVRGRLLVAGVEARSSTVEQARTMVGDQYRSFAKLAAEFNIRE